MLSLFKSNTQKNKNVGLGGALVTANNARKMREQNARNKLNFSANAGGGGALVTANNARKMREQNARNKLNFSANVGGGGGSNNNNNNALKRFAGAKGIVNLRAYNKMTTQRNNLMNKNRLLFFNQNNKKPLLAFVPQKLRDSNISALGKILGRDYAFQANGPMGPGHYNKQFVSQLMIPNNPLIPGPVVPGIGPDPGPGPIVPFGGGASNNNNNIRRRCAELLREKAMIEKQLRELGCDSKNGR